MLDHDTFLEKIEYLFSSTHCFNVRELDRTRSYIDAGDYPLAVENIAYAFVSTKTKMPPALFSVFSELVEYMELDKDPEYIDAATLRHSPQIVGETP